MIDGGRSRSMQKFGWKLTHPSRFSLV